jgi:hypothetical protein
MVGMGELKPGWRRVKFGDVVRLNRETSKHPVADGLHRYLGLEHLAPGDLRIRSWGDISQGTTFTNRFRPGHVLFGKRRAYQRKVAVAEFDGVCSGDIYVFEPKDPAVLLEELLPFICQTDAFFDHAVGTSAGSLSPRTNWKSLAKYTFTLPPADEQRRMASCLNAVQRQLDAQRVLGRVRQRMVLSVLSEAFGHELCLTGPVKWLRDRHHEIASGRGEYRPLRDVVEAIIDYRGKTPPYDDSGTVPVVSQEDVQDRGLEPTTKWVTDKTAREWTNRGVPKGGDIVFRMERFPGEVARLPERRQILTRGVFAIRAKTVLVGDEYLFWYLHWLKRGGYWRIHAHATTVPRLYKNEVLDTPIRVFDRQSQARLVSKLAKLELAGALMSERMEASKALGAKIASNMLGARR